jgi:hypothetical protein
MLTRNNRNRLIALMMLGLLAGCGEQGSEFRLLVPALEFDQLVAAELVEVFEQNSIHEITLVPMPDAFATPLDAIEAGHADLAFASNAQPYRQGVTTVMPLYPTVLHILHKRDRDASDTRKLLQGANVFAGPEGSSSRLTMEAILTGLDMTGDDVSFVIHPNELPDVAVIFVPVSPEEFDTRLAGIGGAGQYNLLGFGSPEEIGTGSAVDRAVFLNPRLSPFVIPVETYKDMVPEPVVTLAVDKLLVANPDVPAAAIYDLIGEIRRLQPALSTNRPMLFRDLSEEFDAGGSTFVLHPGSQAFSQRDEPDVYERYSGVPGRSRSGIRSPQRARVPNGRPLSKRSGSSRAARSKCWSTKRLRQTTASGFSSRCRTISWRSLGCAAGLPASDPARIDVHEVGLLVKADTAALHFPRGIPQLARLRTAEADIDGRAAEMLAVSCDAGRAGSPRTCRHCRAHCAGRATGRGVAGPCSRRHPYGSPSGSG